MSARSFLFVPGNRPERFTKALQSGADAVIIDLEDAVPAQAKLEARTTVAAWLSAEHPVYVRANGHGSEWHDEDVRVIARGAGLRGLVLPKAQDPRRVAELAEHLASSASLLPIIESAQGLWNALEIARCPRVERIFSATWELTAKTKKSCLPARTWYSCRAWLESERRWTASRPLWTTRQDCAPTSNARSDWASAANCASIRSRSRR
jgi:citrate lyase subunit beta/citryl-CoA lyase